MIKIHELERILKIKQWSNSSKKVALELNIPLEDLPPEVLLPYLHADYLIAVIEREVGFELTEDKLTSLKKKKK